MSGVRKATSSTKKATNGLTFHCAYRNATFPLIADKAVPADREKDSHDEETNRGVNNSGMCSENSSGGCRK